MQNLIRENTSVFLSPVDVYILISAQNLHMPSYEDVDVIRCC